MPTQILTIAQNISNTVTVQVKPVNVVLYGQKIVSKEMDDGYVRQCGEGSAKKLDVTAVPVSTGKEFIAALENAGRISACVFWGHSWNIGLYLQNDKGMYVDYYNNGNGIGAAKLQDLRKSSVKTRAHSLFIFASCGTAGAGSFSSISFAVQFADSINKVSDAVFKSEETGTKYYKITTIGATHYSNLFTDGTARTDGEFIQIEKKYKISKKAKYKTVESGMLFWKKSEQVLEGYEITPTLIQTKNTSLGKRINVTEIINKHNPDDTKI